MSLPSEESSIEYAGNNSDVTPYPIPFKFFTDEDISVVVTDEDGIETTLTLNAQFIVSGGDSEVGATGSLTTTMEIPVTSTVLIEREVQITQDTVFTDIGKFPSAAVDRAYDKLTMICQQISRKVLLQLATTAETIAGFLTTKATTPAGVKGAIDQATFDAAGYVPASAVEVLAGIINNKVLTPLNAKPAFDGKQDLLLPRSLWAVLAKIKSTNGSVNFIGDSITFDFGATERGVNGYVSLLREAILGNGGENCEDLEEAALFNDQPFCGITVSGSATDTSTSGPCRHAITLNDGAEIRFDGVGLATIFVRFTRSSSAGSLQFIPDGGSPYYTLDCSGADALDVLGGITGASGDHAWVIKAIGTVVITGLYRLQTSSAGRIHINRFGGPGITTAFFTDNPETMASAVKHGGFFDANSVSLWNIALGTNDSHNGGGLAITSAAYEANLRTICAAILAAKQNDIIAIYSPYVLPSDTVYDHDYDYRNAARRVAADFNAAFVDFGDVDMVGRNLLSDGIHPTDEGHGILYQECVNILSEKLPLILASRGMSKSVYGPNGSRGGSIVAYQNGTAVFSSGCHWNGTAWVADATTAGLFLHQTGSWLVYGDSGLTVGDEFSPTLRFSITDAGVVTASGSITAGIGQSIAVTGGAQQFFLIKNSSGVASYLIGRAFSSDNANDFFIYNAIAARKDLGIDTSGNWIVGGKLKRVLPTSASGLSSGEEWNNAGVVNVVP